MNIKNIALVRATNVVPLDGEVLPICQSKYIAKSEDNDFAYYLGKVLRKEKEYDLLNEEDGARYHKDIKEILPYSCDYNSTINFSLNGIVPDDINNTFSDKDCAIIESLEAQIGKAEFVTLVPTDTTIKGKITLSNESILLIRNSKYDKLTIEEKEKLNQNMNIKIFDGDLKEATKNALLETGKYTPEEVSIRNIHGGYVPSETSEETKEAIQKVAEENNIEQKPYYNTGMAQNDLKYANMVEKYYQDQFFKFMFDNMEIDKELATNLTYYENTPGQYIEQFVEKIEEMGLTNYAEIVKKFNSNIEEIAKAGEIKTPESIVELMEKEKAKDKDDFQNRLEQGVNESIDDDIIENKEPREISEP